MKKIYFVLDDESYIVGGISYGTLKGDHVKTIEISEEHSIFSNDPETFKYENGELIFDEARKEKLLSEQTNSLSKEERNEEAILELAEMVAEMRGMI